MAKAFTKVDELMKDLPVFSGEWEEAAKQKLEKGPFDFLRSGAGDEQTLLNNRRAFDKWSILPRVLRDVSTANTETELLGETITMPLLLAPVGYQGIFHPDGELAAVRAAAKAGIPYISSTVTTSSLEEIAEAAPESHRWFQLYWSANRNIAASMAQRAEKAGYKAIVVTVDTGLLGWRKSDVKNGYSPLKLMKGAANYINDPVFKESVPVWNDEAIREAILENIVHPNLVWEDMLFLREHTTLPIFIKGILHPADAQKAAEIGMDGIIVSNHGGRQLDSAIASLDALPAVSSAVNGSIPVLIDSGFRSGTDIFKALALGADAVLIGRPYIYGLAVAGEEGVTSVIEDLRSELELTYALSGIIRTKEISAHYLVRES